MANGLSSLFWVFVPFIIMLGVLIFVHEFGHFITAKIFKVKVLHFAFGFGPWIFHKKIGETEYGIKPFPIGGSVRLLGDPSEIEDTDEKLTPEDEKRALFNQPAWKKIVIFGAGAVINIAMAFAIAPAIYWIGIERSYFEIAPANVGSILPGSPAEEAGVKPGDVVVTINGKKIKSFQNMITTEMLNPGQVLTYKIQRGRSVIEKKIKMAQTKDEAAGYSGIFLPGSEPVVGGVMKKSAADKAGLKPDDKILAINGQAIHYWHEMTGYIQASKGKPLTFEIQRNSTQIELKVQPEFSSQDNRYLVGIEQKIPTVFVKYGFVEGLQAGFAEAYNWFYLTLQTIGKLFSGKLSWKAMSGPVGIAKVSSEAAREGLSHFITLLVIISVNLGILNLLPIPPLDGSHILITVIEATTRRTLNKKVKETIFTAMYFLLIAFMILVTFNDILRLRGSISDWFMNILKSLGLG